MKKLIKILFISVLILIQLFPLQAFASEVKQEQWQDVVLSEEEFNRILEMNTSEDSQTKATGLISVYNLAINMSGSNLIVTGKIICTTEVKKCGFKEVVIQRRVSENSSWTDYLTYEKIYADTYSHVLSKQLAASTSYQYRVKCTFYAKKNIFSTQTITSYSNIV